MGNTRSCDKHPNNDNFVEKDNIRNVVFLEWKKIDGKNYLFQNKVDYCIPCRDAELQAIAVHRKDVGKNWTTTVWKTGKNGKRYSQDLSPEEFEQHLKEEALEAERKELQALRAGIK